MIGLWMLGVNWIGMVLSVISLNRIVIRIVEIMVMGCLIVYLIMFMI